MSKEVGVVSIYSYLDTLNDAIRELKRMGEDFEVYSPTPDHHIEHAMFTGQSSVRWFTLTGNLSGITLGLVLTWWVNYNWPIITAGKPYLSFPAFLVIFFELFILLGVLFTVAGLVVNAKLPSIKLPESYDPRFSEDKYGIFIRCPDDRKESVTELLQKLGAEETRNVG